MLPHLRGSSREEICAVSIHQREELGRLVCLEEALAGGPADAIPGRCPRADWFAGWIWVRRARAVRTGVRPTALAAPLLSPVSPRVSHEDGLVTLQDSIGKQTLAASQLSMICNHVDREPQGN